MKKHIVDDIMTRDVITVGPSTGYKEIVETLARHAVSAVPVVNDLGHVIGVVSEADLLHKVEYADKPNVGLLDRKRVREGVAKAGADTAADLMTRPAVVIGAHETVTAAAKLMDVERVKRLPVIDGDGRLVGVVSRADVLRLYLRTDEDIRREVIEEAILRTLWIDPSEITVEVSDGVVTLGGELDRRSSVRLVAHVVSGVAGVVDVVDRLGYRYDDTRRHPERVVAPTIG